MCLISWIKSIDSGDIVIGVFLDLNKSVWYCKSHHYLKKMFAYGSRGNILNWFDNYLTNISQFIMYDNIQSETRSIKCGVPQDPIMGPSHFIIFMTDICNVSELLHTIMYADDTSAIMSVNDLKSLIQSVNSELCLLNTRLKANKLSLNVNTTYVMKHNTISSFIEQE